MPMTKKDEIIEAARRLGIADENKIRNLQIIDEFKKLRQKRNPVKNAIRILSDKFFLSYKSIEVIIYKKL